jgi:hypothetical protein
MESLRQKLFGSVTSFTDKLNEFISGSYETQKTDASGDHQIVTNTPNITDRLQGKQTESYAVKKDTPVPLAPKPFVAQTYNQDTKPNTPTIATPRPETGFNKLRAGIDHLMNQPVPLQKATVVDSGPSLPPKVEQQPIVEPKDNHEVFRKGILYNENRGAIQAGKDPYQSVGPTGDIGKYQASPATISAWSKPWLGKKYTAEEFKKDPTAQEKFFTEFTKVKEKYGVSNEDAAIMWHRGWGILGYKGTFEEKKQKLHEYLSSIRNDAESKAYLKTFREGTTT